MRGPPWTLSWWWIMSQATREEEGLRGPARRRSSRELRPEPHKPTLVPERPYEASQGVVHAPCLFLQGLTPVGWMTGQELTELLYLHGDSQGTPGPGASSPASPLAAAGTRPLLGLGASSVCRVGP